MRAMQHIQQHHIARLTLSMQQQFLFQGVAVEFVFAGCDDPTSEIGAVDAVEGGGDV